MKEENYVVATIKPWNKRVFNEKISKYPGKWHLIAKSSDLKFSFINEIRPKYIFFPHWSELVPESIINITECVCFHATDLPFGRGGSPIQNLISRGYKETIISALRMTKQIDAGPIYMKRHLSLEGLAEDIFARASNVISEMIFEIIRNEPAPKKQLGNPTFFKRRTPDQSEVLEEIDSLDKLYDHVRMLDADGYPRAFMNYGQFRLEFSKPSFQNDIIETSVRISINNKKDD